DEAGRPAMLESAIAFREYEQQEQVTIEIARRAKQADVRFAQRRQVAANARHVDPLMTPHCNGVRDARRLELSDEQVADFHRVVDQFVVTVGIVVSEAVTLGVTRVHGGGHPPLAAEWLRRRANLYFAGLESLSDHLREHAGPVEIGMRRVEVRPAHAQVVRVDLEGDGERFMANLDLPAALVDLGQFKVTVSGPRVYGNDVAREIPHQVTARDPGWYREHLPVRVGFRDAQRHFEQVRAGIRGSNAVAVRFGGHRGSINCEAFYAYSGSATLSVRHFAEPPALRNSDRSISCTVNPAIRRLAFNGSEALLRNTRCPMFTALQAKLPASAVSTTMRLCGGMRDSIAMRESKSNAGGWYMRKPPVNGQKQVSM